MISFADCAYLQATVIGVYSIVKEKSLKIYIVEISEFVHLAFTLTAMTVMIIMVIQTLT